MGYSIQRNQPVPEEIKRIIDGRIESAIRDIDADMDRHETVHEVRKRCKEARAALRLVRPVLPSYSEENAYYRDAARQISSVRDAQAAVEIFDKHVRPAVEDSRMESDTLDDMQETVVSRRDDLAPSSVLQTQLKSVREELIRGQERVPGLTIDGDGYDAMAGGLEKSYKRARNRMVDAYEDPESEAYHEWRKRVEYHRDHIALLRGSWEGPMEARKKELQRLAEIIGDETDLAEFATAMHEEELFDYETREELAQVISGRRSQLQRQARPLGERLFAETSEQIVARVGEYWNMSREIEHDASDLTIANSNRTTKSKPGPRPDPESEEANEDANEKLPEIMQEYSDKWYRPDSNTYNYTVRMPDGNRAYRKTQDGAVGVIQQYYETETNKK